MKAAGSPLRFRSSDGVLEQGFSWAKTQAQAYVFLDDPVGGWYEASLPGREAFCMRDVSHQAEGARFLGLAPLTRNMFHRFARSIAESRDWCAFWEIDKTGAPCPADYKDDSSFWYNLPASFDLLQACVREYLGTADRTYIEDPAFRHFYEAAVSWYVERWDRDGDGIPEHHPGDGVRGLGSYNEGKQGRAAMIGGDLIALQYAAFRSYARLMEWRGKGGEASIFEARARALKESYNAEWWDRGVGLFHGLRLHDGSFAGDYVPESQVFPLLCGLIDDGPRIDRTLTAGIEAPRPNVEVRSYFPAAWYLYGRNEEATAELRALTAPDLPRREYPEVSFAMIGSLISGLMGVEGDARERVVTTLPRLPKSITWASVEDVPVLGNTISVRHESDVRTSCRNVAGPPLFWCACFPGSVETLMIDGVHAPALSGTGPNGQPRSWAPVRMEPGSEHTVAFT